MEELNRFVILAQTERFTLTDLCEQFGISRKTGYKHLDNEKRVMLRLPRIDGHGNGDKTKEPHEDADAEAFRREG